jgi:hypothetical protein
MPLRTVLKELSQTFGSDFQQATKQAAIYDYVTIQHKFSLVL